MSKPAASGQVVTVSNAAELRAALKHAGDDVTVLMRPGDYGAVSVRNYRGEGLTIASADPGHPATATLSIIDSQNVTVRGLSLETSGAKWSNALSVTGSRAITVDRNHFAGIDPAMGDGARGLYVNKSEHVAVTDNSFAQLVRGAVFTNSEHLDVLRNDVRNVRSEGFNFAGVKDVEIGHNTGGDFSPRPGDHPDFIQFWTNGVKGASEHIHIFDNSFVQGSGGGAQGIFLGNEDDIPYRYVLIENNRIESSYPNGIVVDTARGVVVRDNVAVASGTSPAKIQIRVSDSEKVLVEDNAANAINVLTSKGVTEHDNIIVPYAKPGATPLPPPVPPVDDHPVTLPGLATVEGTAGSDRLSAGKADAYLIGHGGDDVLTGRAGDDVIRGGDGNDMMSGGAGADTFVFDAHDATPRPTTTKIFDLDFDEGDRFVFEHYDNRVPGGDHVEVSSLSELVAAVQRSNGGITAEQKGSTHVLVITIHGEDGSREQIHISNFWQGYAEADAAA